MAGRLKYSDIKFVRRHEKDGVTYEWFVACKSFVTGCRSYCNYVKNARGNWVTAVQEYSVDRLPKTVQKYIANNISRQELREADDDGYACYLIQEV